jgi:hypothetical protein
MAMNVTQIKTQIIVIQASDWLLVVGLIGYLVYAYTHSYSLNLIMVVAIVGLMVIHQFGKWSISRVAYLQQTLKRLQSTPHVR